MNQRLRELSDVYGQSPWLDNLQRSYLTSGKLKDLVNSGVRGLTSNPTIFQKAIQGSTDYDAQFKSLMSNGLSVVDAYWEMVLMDIHGALDVFEPLFEQSNGTDGFVSVEVDPSLAHDTEGTLNAARQLHEQISRANVMIKIPATREGLPAIQQMIAEGRNVNVTLIFSLERYQEVMDAYIAGLQQRLSTGNSLAGISSVASFFISRVDNEVDSRLRNLGTAEALALCGTTAINQARLAYELFQRTFSGPQWELLVAQGATPQRPLWASTSTKDPSYPDTLYVDELIGRHTVNTLPDSTLEAFASHGVLSSTIEKDLQIAHDQWDKLPSLGINISDVATKLETEGVSSFVNSFNDLLSALESKRLSLSE
jgi:transaldolase